jgi:hypothetical protein
MSKEVNASIKTFIGQIINQQSINDYVQKLSAALTDSQIKVDKVESMRLICNNVLKLFKKTEDTTYKSSYDYESQLKDLKTNLPQKYMEMYNYMMTLAQTNKIDVTEVNKTIKETFKLAYTLELKTLVKFINSSVVKIQSKLEEVKGSVSANLVNPYMDYATLSQISTDKKDTMQLPNIPPVPTKSSSSSSRYGYQTSSSLDGYWTFVEKYRGSELRDMTYLFSYVMDLRILNAVMLMVVLIKVFEDIRNQIVRINPNIAGII